MRQSAFEHLAGQFSGLCDNLQKVDIIETQEAMRSAGKVFFIAVSKEKIYFSEVPSLLKKKPKQVKKKTGKSVYVWALYWWETIAWLSKKDLDSGIIYAARTKRLKPKKWTGIYSLKRYLVTREQLPTEKLNKVCYDLAKASETACLWLTDIINNTPSRNRMKNKKDNKSWKPSKGYIGSIEIAIDYNVPRTTLQSWEEKTLGLKTEKDPQSHEKYFPKIWFNNKLRVWKPRNKNKTAT